MTRPKTETVPTTDLRVGDTILAHGCVMRVREQRLHDSDAPNGPTAVNLCDYLGDLDEAVSTRYFPRSWRDNWNEQGNSLGRSTRILEDVTDRLARATEG